MVGFNDVRGEAQKGIDRMSLVDGENRFRTISGLRPRYVYWAKTAGGEAIPLECLSFNVEKEKFDNREKDWVRELIPMFQEKDDKGKYKENCKWSYCALVIDRSDNKVKLLDFRKGMFGEIKSLAGKKLGDPIDYENGWDIVVEREKTGPKAFNVKYSVDQLSSSETKGPLSQEDKETIAKFLDIEVDQVTGPDCIDINDFVPRMTPEEQKELILNKVLAVAENEEDTQDDVPDDLDDGDDDVPL